MADEPHSKQFLTDDRDRWWSPEQIRGIADRLGLSAVRTAVDVGAGQGHWSRVVASVLPEGATLFGIEREEAWVQLASKRDDGVRYRLGLAEALPFDDANVDLVTAQTLLIHVADPRAVVREMARVLRPGGALWLVEPNNLASLAMYADPATDIDALVAAFRLEAVCERGKHALGLGYNSIGERLVGLLDPAHWRDVEMRLCDRVQFVAPPYPPELLAASEPGEEVVTWPRAETERYFLAGGGDAREFARLWDASLALQHARTSACEAGTYAAAEGVMLYALTARRA